MPAHNSKECSVLFAGSVHRVARMPAFNSLESQSLVLPPAGVGLIRLKKNGVELCTYSRLRQIGWCRFTATAAWPEKWNNDTSSSLVCLPGRRFSVLSKRRNGMPLNTAGVNPSEARVRIGIEVQSRLLAAIFIVR